MKRFISPGLALLLFGSVAGAQTVAATDSMGVSITIQAGCTVSAQDLSFGTVSVVAANVDAQTTVQVTCTNGTDYEIAANSGANSVDPAARLMVNGGEDVQYSIYTDPGRSTIWNDTTGLIPATGTGAAQDHIVYGRVPPQTTPSPATYTDTVLVTVLILP